jgi:hypothetical protein
MLDHGTLTISWDEVLDAPVAILEGDLSPLALNMHIRTAWEPAHEWTVASETDAEW